jgi:glyoxylase-like metal-dependent hydrolase (beta-lactamase superfamily II)
VANEDGLEPNRPAEEMRAQRPAQGGETRPRRAARSEETPDMAEQAAQLFEVAPGITGIDTRMVGRSKVTAAYLVSAERPALIETGPSRSIGAVEEGLDAIGIGRESLAHVVVSHIHLDHAGGAGDLLSRYPNATLWAHERGVPHLADPTRLLASTIRAYGEDRVASMFGAPRPVPAERLRPLSEGTQLDLGGRVLEVMNAPGHARHEVFVRDRDTGALFTGDGFGVLLPDVGILRPAAPPPEFDLELATDSIRRACQGGPSMLVFSHFGAVHDVEETCELAVDRLHAWTDAVRRALQDRAKPADVADVAEVLRESTAGETEAAAAAGLDVGRYEFLSSYELNAAGILRYLTQRAAGR